MNKSNEFKRRLTSTNYYRAGYNSDGDIANSNGGNLKQYMFDAVHGEKSMHSKVYDSVKGIVDAVMDGYNGTIVA